MDLPKTTEISRVKRLKAETHDMHEALDQRIMRAAPFSSRERYGAFLKMQHQFHRDLDALYVNPVLDRLLPDLEGRRRLRLVAEDLADLGLSAPDGSHAPVFPEGRDADLPTALGWLYVAEGSNLGAAFLLKEAAKLDLTDSFGARHLAAAPEGRGLHWKTFTAALDALELTPAEEERVVEGARAAFKSVRARAETFFAN